MTEVIKKIVKEVFVANRMASDQPSGNYANYDNTIHEFDSKDNVKTATNFFKEMKKNNPNDFFTVTHTISYDDGSDVSKPLYI